MKSPKTFDSKELRCSTVSFLERVLQTVFLFKDVNRNAHMSEGAVLGWCGFLEGKWLGAERGTAVLKGGLECQSMFFRAVCDAYKSCGKERCAKGVAEEIKMDQGCITDQLDG